MSKPDRNRLYEMAEPWAVLAVGTLITCCRQNNFSTIDFLRAPLIANSTIDDNVASVTLPKWFPLEDAIFETPDGSIYTRVRDLPFVFKRKPVSADNVEATLDLTGAPISPAVKSFVLNYFPWYRFLVEPVAFDALGRAADYVTKCLKFLAAREGFDVRVEESVESRVIDTGVGVRIEIAGGMYLNRLRILDGEMQSVFDVEARSIDVDSRMFPAIAAAVAEMLKTDDRLDNMTVTQVEGKVHFASAGAHGAARV